MLKNYLIIALRSIYRNRLYAAVAIIGLGVGLAVCLLTVRYVAYELSFDRFEGSSRVFGVENGYKLGGVFAMDPTDPAGLTRALKSYFPKIEDAVSVYGGPTIYVSRGGGNVTRMKCRYSAVGADFFKVFRYPLLEGDPNTCLQQPNSIVLSRKFAIRCFGTTNVVGKTIRAHYYGIKSGMADMMVTAIMNNRVNSSLAFDAVGRGLAFPYFRQFSRAGVQWGRLVSYSFVKVHKGIDPASIAERFPAFIDAEGGDSSEVRIGLVPLSSIHFRLNWSALSSVYPIKYLFILSAVAFLILIVSAVNFIGINLVLFTKRLREVGLRRVVGAGWKDLAAQFLVQNSVLTLASLLVGVCLAELLIPWFDSMMNLSLRPYSPASPLTLGLMTGVIVISDVLMGIYSIRYFRSYNAQMLIKGEGGIAGRHLVTRRALLGLQFTVGAFLICCAAVTLDQLNYIRHKNLGFDPDNILVVRKESVGDKASILKSELQRNPDVLSTTVTGWVPGGNDPQLRLSMSRRNRTTMTLNMAWVDKDFFKTFGLSIIKGGNFSSLVSSEASDRSDSGSVILNQSAFSELERRGGSMNSINTFGNHWQMIGIMKNFNYQSLIENIKPVVLIFGGIHDESNVAVKIMPGKDGEVLSYLKSIWKSVNPSRELEYYFLRNRIDSMYSNMDRMLDALMSGAVLTIVIALMGIFALCSFKIERKTKEIAIRKVLGSSIPGIIDMLAADFVRLLLLANLVAWPTAYFVMKSWLENFAYRVGIDLIIFPSVGLAMLVLALATILLRAFRAARANPVESLRYE